MKRAAAQILREYGPFTGAERVNGVTYDGKQVWFASGDKLHAFDPKSGKALRAIDVAAHAGTAYDGQHLFQIADEIIQKIDPNTGRVLATIPTPAWRRLRTDLGRKIAVGGTTSAPQDSSSRSANWCDPPHHRVQPVRHRGDLGRWRALACDLGRRRERFAAHRSANRRGFGKARHAGGHRRVRLRVRWRGSILLRWRLQRQSARRPPTQAKRKTELARGDRVQPARFSRRRSTSSS